MNRSVTEKQLLGIKGIGPWTASYVAMRALATRTRSCPPTSGSTAPSKNSGAEATRRLSRKRVRDGGPGEPTLPNTSGPA